MKEIEVKVLGIDIEAVKDKLYMLGALSVKNEIQENYYYNLPGYIQCRDGYIRIRKIHNLNDDTYKIILCIKKIISQGSFRTSDEHEIEVLDFEAALEFFNSLDLKFLGREDKHRESYLLDGALVEIDTWDKTVFPEPYIELEAENYNMILSVLSKLGIPEEKATSKSLREIKKEMGLI